jgi:quercetin dioxygenase-like cupin family protein
MPVPFVDIRDLEVKEPLPGWKARFLHSEQMTFAYYDIEAGAAIHVHDHPNEEVWHVLEGELEVTIAGATTVARPGCVALVPPNTPHAVKARTAGRAIVVDHPRRAAIGGVTTD